MLGGILLFFIVEKIVRQYEELSSHGGQRAPGNSHYHHQKKKNEIKKLEAPEKIAAVGEVEALENKESESLETKRLDIKKVFLHCTRVLVIYYLKVTRIGVMRVTNVLNWLGLL
jgi:hypothetical protein